MRIRFLAPVAIVGLFIAGCDGYSGEEKNAVGEHFEVHLSASFNDHPVVVELDGREIFRGRVSNEIPSVSEPEVSPFDLAAVLSAELPLGAHMLEVTIDGVVQDEVRFETNDELFVIVTYVAETGELQFALLDEMPQYG